MSSKKQNTKVKSPLNEAIDLTSPTVSSSLNALIITEAQSLFVVIMLINSLLHLKILPIKRSSIGNG